MTTRDEIETAVKEIFQNTLKIEPEQIKPGVVLLAQRAGAPILPVYLSARPEIRMPSWDRMRLPLPFSRIRIRFDEPIEVPAELDAEGMEALRLALEKRMAAGQAALDAELAGTG